MHDRSPQNAKNRHRNQKLDPAAATPSTRFNPRSFVAALGGLALLGTLAACAAGPTAAHETSISIAATTAPSATPTTVATPSSVATPTTVATPATVGPPTTIAHSSAVVDEFATVDGARMHIRCVGAGATTVVLIGGFNDGGDNWGAIEAPLARGRPRLLVRPSRDRHERPADRRADVHDAGHPAARRARISRRARTIRPRRPLLRRRRGGCVRVDVP